ncbi:CDP-diacylglycerol--serine O-phosphatidyltransferase [Methanothrix sp.]|uniref:CDP-diacylglycerol--serine O-phosphatidyltransferase n=1 Tax=Methanothrix sp. TaxID=90426 RepID=UPI0032975C2E
MNILRALRPPDLFTMLNIALGFAAILVICESQSLDFLKIAVVLIILAATADGLDGFVARKKESGPLGANLDSLADLVSFGAAPAFLVVQAFSLPFQIWPAAIFFVICGALRLARFNISNKSDQLFEGLPIPAAGMALSASALLGRPGLTVTLMLILALLMISSIPYPKIRDKRVLSISGLFTIAAAWAVFFQSNTIYTATLLGALIIMYLLSPVVISRLQKGK